MLRREWLSMIFGTFDVIDELDLHSNVLRNIPNDFVESNKIPGSRDFVWIISRRLKWKYKFYRLVDLFPKPMRLQVECTVSVSFH